MYTCYIALNKTLYRADEGLDIRPNLGNSKKCDCAVQVCIINVIINSFVESFWNIYMYTHTHRVSRGGCARLWQNVPYVKVHRYNPKHHIRS